jgi:hypothetical protein
MSKELIATIKNNMPVVRGLDEDTKAVAGGMGGKRISIKGGVFRKMVGGKQVSVVEGRKMAVIFVKMAHAASRTYYPNSYKEGDKVSPTCWSTDGRTPDAEVKAKQSASCESCPMSVKGSGQGGTGSACRLQWRTAVILPHDADGDVMQLVLPATSCFGKEENGRWPFRPYIQMLASNNISAGAVVTQMEFDTNSPVPKLLFSPIAAVDEETIQSVQRQAASAPALNAVKLNVYQQDEGTEPAAPVKKEYVTSELPEETESVDTKVVIQWEVAEPVVRESSKTDTSASDVPDVIKKWAKKKQ